MMIMIMSYEVTVEWEQPFSSISGDSLFTESLSEKINCHREDGRLKWPWLSSMTGSRMLMLKDTSSDRVNRRDVSPSLCRKFD